MNEARSSNPSIPDRVEALVFGGGIVGAAAAYHLARAGLDTLLVDAGHEGRATDAGAGILAPETSSRTEDDDWFAFATAAVAHYRPLVDRLDAAGIDHGYDARDLVSVAVDADEVPALEDALARTRERESQLAGSVAELDPGEVAARFPPVADVRRAMLVTGAARVDGGRFAVGLTELAGESEGLATLAARVDRVVVEDGRVVGVEVAGASGPDGDADRTRIDADRTRIDDDRTRIDADHVVVAGGAWSGSLAADLGLDLPVFPMRGEIAHLRIREDDAVPGRPGEWPIVAGFREHYMAPWPDGRLVAGATRDPDAGFDPRATAGGVREVLDEALRVAPGLSDAELAEVRVGLRPASPDGRPAIGAVPGVEGAYVATGHGPTGLMLGPYSGKVVADLVRGKRPDVNLGAFAPDRF